MAGDERARYDPQPLIQPLFESLRGLSPTDRIEKVERLKQQAIDYHEGFRRERIPEHVDFELKRMTVESARLNRVDSARDYLDKHGGPLSREEIRMAVHEHALRRMDEMAKTPVAVPESAEKSIRKTREKAMEI